MSTFGTRLEAVTNVFLILASVCVVAVLGMSIFGAGAPSAPPQAVAYQKGDVLPVLTGVDYGASRRTLVVVVAPSCKYCVEDTPVYSRLASLRRKGSFQLVLAGADTTDALSAFCRNYGVDADRIVTIAPGALRVAGTPTLILVDRGGRVVSVWRGRLGRREQEVVEAIES